jgi:hypothetical protein
MIEADDKVDSTDGQIQFKKRGKMAGNIRKKGLVPKGGVIESKEDGNEEGVEGSKQEPQEEDDALGIDRTKLRALDMLNKISNSRRTNGLSVNALNKASGGNDVSRFSALKSGKNNAFNSQFSVKIDHGLQQTAPHEKIMEEYINEQIGGVTKKEYVPRVSGFLLLFLFS